jgi:O-antigen/teichoic acid export membrane protein
VTVIRRSLTVNAAGVIAVALAGFVSMLVLARRLPVEVFGTVSIALMVANAVAVFDGVRPVVIFEATRQNAAIASLHRTVWRLFVAIGSFATLVTLALAFALWREELGTTGVLLLSLVVFLYFPAACNWGFLDARQDTAFTGLVRSVAWLGVYGSFIAITLVSDRPTAYLVPLVAMNGALALAYAWRLGRVPPNAPGSCAASVRDILARSLDNLGVNVAATTIGTFDRVVLSAVGGMHGVGLYSAQYELSTKPAALLRVANTVLLPAAADMQARGRPVEAAWLRVTLAGSLVLAAVAAMAVALRTEIIGLLLGPAYAPHADVFGLLVMALVLQFFGYACPVLLNARGNFSLQRSLYLVAAALMVVAAVPVARTYGIVGLAALYLVVRGVDVALLIATIVTTRMRLSPAVLAAHGTLMAVTMMVAWTGRLVPTLAASALCGAVAFAMMRIPANRYMTT